MRISPGCKIISRKGDLQVVRRADWRTTLLANSTIAARILAEWRSKARASWNYFAPFLARASSHHREMRSSTFHSTQPRFPSPERGTQAKTELKYSFAPRTQ